MKIEGKIKVDGFLTTRDLVAGEVFAFEDDDKHLYMITDDDKLVDVETGEVIYEYEQEERPVKRINAKIVIEG